jgi:hypothetical protein
MFKKIKELQSLVDESRKALKEAERKVERLEISQKSLRAEIEDEHLENYKHHRKLLAIEKLLQGQDYNNTENLKNKIRTILNKKELVDLLKSN